MWHSPQLSWVQCKHLSLCLLLRLQLLDVAAAAQNCYVLGVHLLLMMFLLQKPGTSRHHAWAHALQAVVLLQLDDCDALTSLRIERSHSLADLMLGNLHHLNSLYLHAHSLQHLNLKCAHLPESSSQLLLNNPP